VRERERKIERGRETDESVFAWNPDRVGIDETDNLSLFDKFWILSSLSRIFFSYLYFVFYLYLFVIETLCRCDFFPECIHGYVNNLQRNEFYFVFICSLFSCILADVSLTLLLLLLRFF